MTHSERPLGWRVRRAFWNGIAVAKFKANKPARIPIPTNTEKLTTVPLSTAEPELPIANIRVANKVPADEASRLSKLVYKVQVGLYTR
jgi:hypothetical protein